VITVLIILSGLFFVSGLGPYLSDIIKRRTKPRIVSWFNWTLLTGIATAAALAEHQYASAFITGVGTICTALIVILSLRYSSDRKFETLDVVCQICAVIGLVLWASFDNPTLALVASMSIDFIVGLPTWKHAWFKPWEETAAPFVLAVVGAACAIVATIFDSSHTVSGLIFPVYLTLANAAIASLILLSPHRQQA